MFENFLHNNNNREEVDAIIKRMDVIEEGKINGERRMRNGRATTRQRLKENWLSIKAREGEPTKM